MQRKCSVLSWFTPHWYGGLFSLVLIVSAAPAVRAQSTANPILQIGVVQRFGEDIHERLTIEALGGDQLNLSFTTNGIPQHLTTTKVVLDLVTEPLPQAELQERVVLSNHRSFESAETSAMTWQQRGISTEIAQPGAWEVWADRDQFNTPLLRRLLVKSLHEQGFTEVYLDSQVISQRAQATFVTNGYRFHRDALTITAGYGQIRVIQAEADTQTNRIYGGNLQLQSNTYGTYTLVNNVPVETYLRGVVPYEIGAGAPPPTIEAQAILARTYALRNLRRFAIDNYQLCADTQCQVYRGLSGATDRTDRAIATTRSQVLTYNNQLIDALYSSTTGGVTASFSDVWDGQDRPYLHAVVDSVQGIWDLALRPLNDERNFRAFIALDQGFNEDTWDLFRWKYDSSLTEIAQDLRTYLGKRQDPMASLSQIRNVTVAKRASSGRVQRLDIETDLGTVELQKDEIVRVLTAPRSLLFYVEPIMAAPLSTGPSGPVPNPTSPGGTSTQTVPPVLVGFHFIGGGWGHGVGLSQTGAYHLGKLGWTSARILQFYYPGTTLKKLDQTITFWSEPTSLEAANGDNSAQKP